MFKQKSPVKKKFGTIPATKKRRRPLNPRTRLLLRQIVIGTGLCVCIAVIITGIWFGTRLTFFTIATVTVDGGETINHDEVRAKVEEQLQGEYLGLVPRRFVWLYPQEAITTAVQSIPRLKEPMVERDGTIVSVTFTEYIPHALWCDDKTSEHCLFIDDAGFAFAEAPQLSGGAFPRFHVIGSTPVLKTFMLPSADLVAIETLREQVSDTLDLPILYVETDIMRDVFMGVAGGGEIKATLRMSPLETFDNLQTVLSSPAFKNLAPGNFQYIDLRFGNKVFVNEELPTVATTSASSTDSHAVPEDTTPATSTHQGTNPIEEPPA